MATGDLMRTSQVNKGQKEEKRPEMQEAGGRFFQAGLKNSRQELGAGVGGGVQGALFVGQDQEGSRKPEQREEGVRPAV